MVLMTSVVVFLMDHSFGCSFTEAKPTPSWASHSTLAWASASHYRSFQQPSGYGNKFSAPLIKVTKIKWKKLFFFFKMSFFYFTFLCRATKLDLNIEFVSQSTKGRLNKGCKTEKRPIWTAALNMDNPFLLVAQTTLRRSSLVVLTRVSTWSVFGHHLLH